jgi:hypothetical protein
VLHHLLLLQVLAIYLLDSRFRVEQDGRLEIRYA